MKKLCAAIMCAALGAGSAYASSDKGADKDGIPVGVGIVAGTTGLGVQLATPLTDNIAVRAQFTKYSATYDGTADNIDYRGDLDLGSAGLYLDWHPFSGSFRISAGLTNNLTKASIYNTSTGNVTIGDNTYTIQPKDLRGDVDLQGLAPYLGIGWGHSVSEGLGMRFDIGAHFVGKPDISYKASSSLQAQATAAGYDLNADLAKEAKKAEDDIGPIIYPEVSLTVVYTFDI